MIPLKQAINSSVGKKLITAITGLGLIIFVILHLLGNLTLLVPGAITFNTYAASLERLGALLLVAELGLVAVFLGHIVNGVMLKRNHWAARPVAYRELRTKGGPSKSGLSSRNMIVSGLVLLIFLGIHLWQFKFGPGVHEGYVTQIKGEEARDLHRLAVEIFARPLNVAFYVGCMLFLGGHLKHGVWSSFQSLGILNKRLSGPVYLAGWVLAVLLSIGFLVLPIWLYITTGVTQ